VSPWPTVPLGELAKPKQWPTLSKVEMMESGFPVYGANGRIGYHDTFTHEKPTILIGCRGSCGTVHVTEPESYANGNAMALDELDESRADLDFLVQFFRQRGFRDVTSGTSQPQIIRQNIVRVEIPLPPLAEQRRIAEVLDRAEALRAKRRAALAQLDLLTQSLFLDLFGDPATNPKRWPVQQLQEVVKEGTIVTYGIVQAGEEFPGGVPYIRTGDIVDGEIVTAGLRHTDPVIAAKFGRSRVEAGDIVMSIRATVGTTALVPPELDGANLTQGTGKISPSVKTDRLYLLNFLRASGTQHWISLQIKGATFREITLTRLRELPVAVPPITLQREFARRVTAVEALKTAQRASLAELDALFATLQYRAFRGEL
jgi:type I restriction enzyme, S subunit